MTRNILLLLLFFLMACNVYKKQKYEIIMSQYSYLTQNPVITQNGIAFNPDRSVLYVSLPVDARDYRDRPRVKIFARKWENGQFSTPALVNFSREWSDYHPVLSPDGQRMYFNSTRPIPGETGENRQVHLWYVEKQGEHWSEAKYLSVLNLKGYHSSYPSVAADGSLYFNSDRPGGQGGMDIWLSKSKNGVFQKPEAVAALNSKQVENDLCIDPQGRFFIFNRYIPETNAIDLWVSLKKDDSWQSPVLLKSINQDSVWELTPYISPDGEHFLCEINGVIHIWEMDMIIEQISP